MVDRPEGLAAGINSLSACRAFLWLKQSDPSLARRFAKQISARLWAEGARTFFVARLSEGEALRTALTPNRLATINVLVGFTDGSATRLAAAQLTPALCTLPQVAAAQAWAQGSGQPFQCTLHIDTGMNRQGLTTDQAHA